MARSYKAVVGDLTRVLKIEVGTPTRKVLISNNVLLNDIVGVLTDDNRQGDLLVYDSASGNYINTDVITQLSLDGKIYPRDSERTIFSIRRSPTAGAPQSLRGGEVAYSYLRDSGTGFIGATNGGERLYFGVGSDASELAERIDVIGGKYFTDLLDHEAGTVFANSALIVDSDKSLDVLLVDILTARTSFTADSATVSNNLTVGGTVSADFFDSISTNSITANRANLDSATIERDLVVKGTLFADIDRGDVFEDVIQILQSGLAINFVIDSASKTLTIEAQRADSNTLGVATYNPNDFNVSATGEVSLDSDLGGGGF